MRRYRVKKVVRDVGTFYLAQVKQLFFWDNINDDGTIDKGLPLLCSAKNVDESRARLRRHFELLKFKKVKDTVIWETDESELTLAAIETQKREELLKQLEDLKDNK